MSRDSIFAGRSEVFDSTLRHELAVLDVRTLSHYELVEFSTWPIIYQFQAA
ncbi:MAG: hypothetical protein ACR2M4_08580 [Actinomycetota bacterium]